MVTDSRYTEQAAQEAPLFEVVEQKEGLLAKAAECVKARGWKKLAFEGNAMTYDQFVKLRGLLGADSAPAKRIVSTAKDRNTAIDATCGKKTRTVIVMDSGHVVMSAKEPSTIQE